MEQHTSQPSANSEFIHSIHVHDAEPFRLPCPGWGWWLLVVGMLLPFAYAFGFLFPRGDDFDEVTRAMFLFDLPGGFYEIAREWLTWSGRYTYHFLAVFLGKAGELRPAYGMVCGLLTALFGVGVFRLARETGASRASALFCGLLATLTVLACHQSLPNLYLLTDALTMGLLQSVTLLFLWALCRLWRCEPQNAQGFRRWAIVVGVLAVGVFEHAALAALAACAVACSLALREVFAARRDGDAALTTATLRLRHCSVVGAWILGAVLFSFLAPGNQVRRTARHIEGDVLWRQVGDAFNEWQHCAFWFFNNVWPWAVLLLVLLLRGLSGRFPAQNDKERAARRSNGLWLAGLSVVAYLGLSGLLTLLHALSDVPLNATPKLSAGLAVFSAYAFGFAIWGVLDAVPSLELRLARLPQMVVTAGLLAPLLLLFATGTNWRATAANAANGGMLVLGRQLQTRYDLLRAIGNAAQASDALPKFGLMGEIYRPGARKRAIDPALPMTAVQASMPANVFPVQGEDALPPRPEQWPNLWVAWMLGLGGVYSAQPSPMPAIEAARRAGENSSTALAVPEQLRQAGVEAAWLVQALGAPSTDAAQTKATFENYWLVLRVDSTFRGERIAVLRANAPDGLRLMPLPLQNALISALLQRRSLPSAETRVDDAAIWATQKLEFPVAPWTVNGYCALPICPADTAPAALFVGLNASALFRLELFRLETPRP